MGSSKKGMLNVLIAAVLWGSSGVCAQFIMQESQMSSPFLTMTRLLFAGLILLMLALFTATAFSACCKTAATPSACCFSRCLAR